MTIPTPALTGSGLEGLISAEGLAVPPMRRGARPWHPFVLSSFSGAKVVKAKNKNKVAPMERPLVLSVLDT